MRRSHWTILGLALLGVTLLLPSAASAASQPRVYWMDFVFTSVWGKRPPNVVETRRVGKGTLFFEASPRASREVSTVSASGKAVLEWDLLTPTPRTARLELAVFGGSAHFLGHEPRAAILGVKVRKSASAVGTPVECGVGTKGQIALLDSGGKAGKDGVLVTIAGCDIKEGKRPRRARTAGSRSRSPDAAWPARRTTPRRRARRSARPARRRRRR